MSGPILLCYDGSPAAGTTIRSAGEFLGAGRDAIVLTVWDDPAKGSSAGVDVAVKALNRDLEEHARKAADEVVQDGVTLAEQAGFTARPMTLESREPVWSAILQVADEQQVDAIVVGARGQSAIKRALLGSVSERVARNADNHRVLVIHHD